jgi:hypothetical protein
VPSEVEFDVYTDTLHWFFKELFYGFDIVDSEDTQSIVVTIKFNHYVSLLNNYLKEGLITAEDIASLLEKNAATFDWDHILIDEAQDWAENERDILYAIYNPEKILIADGMDQLVRSKKRCDWVGRLSHERTHEKRCLRQKTNLVRFINAYARVCGLSWELEPKEELHGGRIVISTREYGIDLHNREFERCKANGNQAYEMLLLVHPGLVEKIKDEDGKEKARFCPLVNTLSQDGDVYFWDGTATRRQSSDEYPTEVTQHRLLQYESCRGLEGWTVVCIELDELIRYKKKDYEADETIQPSLALMSPEEQRDRFVHLWSLIPLTRAIDSLVITIKNPDSQLCGILRQLYEEHRDFVEWLD